VRGTMVTRRSGSDPTQHAPRRYRMPCDYEAFVPDLLAELDVGIDGVLAGLISEAEAEIAELNRSGGSALVSLSRLLLRTESIASSKVEGMQVDARRLARAEVAHDTGRTIGSEAAEVLANIDAMRFAVETASAVSTLTPAHLAEIHRVLLERAMPTRAGVVRTTQGWIGGNDYNPCGATYVPPPEDRLEDLLEDLCRFCSKEELPPLIQAAIAHAQFETIHPFDDGNGRTGRALIQVLFRRRGLAPTFVPPISVVLAAERERYIDGLTRFRQDDLGGWLEIFASSAARSADLARRYLLDVGDLQDRWREMLRATADLRSDAAAWAIIDILPGQPVITVAVAVAVLQTAGTARSRAAVQVAIDSLESAGILHPLGTSKRNRAWEADGLLDLIADLEAGVEPERR
jgi:Fic family protein